MKEVSKKLIQNLFSFLSPKTTCTTIRFRKAGIQYSNKGISVNEHMQTNVSHIYAAGDVIGGIQLAHVAFHEGTTAALHASGEDVKVNYHAVPRCIYTAPEIASVGLTEKDAREQYGDIQIENFPLQQMEKRLLLENKRESKSYCGT